MLYVMVFQRLPDKFSLGIFFPLQNPILIAYTINLMIYKTLIILKMQMAVTLSLCMLWLVFISRIYYSMCSPFAALKEYRISIL